MNEKNLFKGLPASAATRIISDAECYEKTYSDGESIYSEKQFVHAVGLVTDGEAVVKSLGKDGVIVRHLSVDDCFGVAAIFGGAHEYVSDISAVKQCTVLFIPENTMKRYMKEYPVLGFNYIEFLTGRIKYLNTLVDAYSAPTVLSKVSKFIYAHQQGSDVPFGFTLVELSKSLGIGRASLYRALDELEENGVILKSGKQINVLDEERLAHFAQL